MYTELNPRRFNDSMCIESKKIQCESKKIQCDSKRDSMCIESKKIQSESKKIQFTLNLRRFNVH